MYLKIDENPFFSLNFPNCGIRHRYAHCFIILKICLWGLPKAWCFFVCHNRSQNTLPIVMKRTSRGDKLTEEKMKDSKWFLHSSHARRARHGRYLYEYDLHAACNKFPCKNVTSGEKFAPRGSPFDGRCELSNVGWGGEFWHGMSSLSHFSQRLVTQSADFSCQTL